MKFSHLITAAALFIITFFTVFAGHAGPIRLGMTPEPGRPGRRHYRSRQGRP